MEKKQNRQKLKDGLIIVVGAPLFLLFLLSISFFSFFLSFSFIFSPFGRCNNQWQQLARTEPLLPLQEAQALGYLAFNAISPWRKGCAFYPLIVVVTNATLIDATLIVVIIEEKEGWGALFPVVFVIVVVVAWWQQQQKKMNQE